MSLRLEIMKGGVFMSRTIILLFLIANILSLCSCSIGGSRIKLLNQDNDSEKIDA